MRLRRPACVPLCLQPPTAMCVIEPRFTRSGCVGHHTSTRAWPRRAVQQSSRRPAVRACRHVEVLVATQEGTILVVDAKNCQARVEKQHCCDLRACVRACICAVLVTRGSATRHAGLAGRGCMRRRTAFTGSGESGCAVRRTSALRMGPSVKWLSRPTASASLASPSRSPPILQSSMRRAAPPHSSFRAPQQRRRPMPNRRLGLVSFGRWLLGRAALAEHGRDTSG